MSPLISRTLLASTTLALALSASLAMAKDEPRNGETPTDSEAAPAKLDFDALDKNKDGGLSTDEIPGDQPLADEFPDVDSDGDGKLSKDEFDAYNQ